MPLSGILTSYVCLTMITLEEFDARTPTDRDLFLLRCGSFSDIAQSLSEFPNGSFVTLIIADFRKTSFDALTSLSESLINAGSRYFCAWGDNCKTAHHAFDLACCEFEPDSKGVIITTDHGSESIDDAIWYTLNCAIPMAPYDQDWKSLVAICVVDDGAAESVRNAFSDPIAFSDRIV